MRKRLGQMVVSQNRGAPIYYDPSYGDPQNDTPSFGTHPNTEIIRWEALSCLFLGYRRRRRTQVGASKLTVTNLWMPAAPACRFMELSNYLQLGL